MNKSYMNLGMSLIILVILSIPFMVISGVFSRNSGYFISILISSCLNLGIVFDTDCLDVNNITGKKIPESMCYLTFNPFYNPISLNVIIIVISFIHKVIEFKLYGIRNNKCKGLGYLEKQVIREQTERTVSNLGVAVFLIICTLLIIFYICRKRAKRNGYQYCMSLSDIKKEISFLEESLTKEEVLCVE